jgi:RNA polymerase sigma-32 factor
MMHLDDVQTLHANARFVRLALRTPNLGRDREAELALRWREHGDEAALHALISAHTKLVVAFARRFRRYGLPPGDLIQEGNHGLLLAAARFQPARNVRFATYAGWWVRAGMQDFIMRNCSIVRAGTTRDRKALFFNLRRLRARLEAREVALSPDARGRIPKLLVQMSARPRDRSLNEPMHEGRREQIQDVLADEAPSPEDIARTRHDSRIAATWLAAAMAELSPRERVIIRRHHLADNALSLTQIGSELGISKQRVGQIEERALAKLRDSLMRRSCEARDLLPC